MNIKELKASFKSLFTTQSQIDELKELLQGMQEQSIKQSDLIEALLREQLDMQKASDELIIAQIDDVRELISKQSKIKAPVPASRENVKFWRGIIDANAPQDQRKKMDGHAAKARAVSLSPATKNSEAAAELADMVGEAMHRLMKLM